MDCPVCDSPALAMGQSDVVDWGDEEATATVLFWPHELICEACGLRLNDQEELEGAGVEFPIDNPDADPFDYVPEPDTDFLA